MRRSASADGAGNSTGTYSGYARVKKLVCDAVASGELKVGDAIPGEREVAGKVALYQGPILLAYDPRFDAYDPTDLPALDLGRAPEVLAVDSPAPRPLLLEDQPRDALPVVVLSKKTNDTAFGGQNSVGRTIKLDIELTDNVGESVAVRDNRVRDEKQAAAEAAFMADPAVQVLLSEGGGKIRAGSIQPSE